MTKASSNSLNNKKNSLYTLAITRQTSLEVENFSQNGQQKKLHYVIKNNTFYIDVAMTRDDKLITPTVKELDFENVTLEASLLYDCTEDKKVACLKVQPLTYKGTIKEGDSKTCVLELTIGVLSSQHEDMNFKVLIQALDNTTHTKIANLFICSEPVQVISKPDVLRKKKLPTVPRKSTANTAILERLSAIEQSLTRIEQNVPATEIQVKMEDAKKICGKRKLTPQETFENAFFALLDAHANLPETDRPIKLQRLINDCSPTQKTNLEEILSNANGSYSLLKYPITPIETPVEISDEILGSLDFSEILREFM